MPLLTAAALAAGLSSGAAQGAESPPLPPASAPAAEPTVTQAASPAPARAAAFAVQGGWWSVEAEWRTRFGVYAAAGIPWVMVPLAIMDHATWVVPVTGRLGYDLGLSPRWSLRANAHAATMVANETGKCGCADLDPVWRTFLFAEVGVRYQSPSGFIAGVDLPVFAFSVPHQAFAPPISLAFTQLYLGHSWGR